MSRPATQHKRAPYPSYKPSGVDWLGEIPEHWEVRPIRSLAKQGYKTFTDGDWIESPFIRDAGIRLIQTGNIGVGIYKEQGFRYIDEETFYNFRCTEVRPGDVLICRLADPVGRACIAPDLGCRMITSVDVCILKTSADTNPAFAVYALSSAGYLAWLGGICRGGTRDRVSRSMLSSIRIQLPPLAEQRAIAAFLDHETVRIDALIEKKRRQIELLQEKRSALISHAVTKGLNPNVKMKDSGIEWLGEIPEHWEVKSIRRIAKAVKTGGTPSGAEEMHFDENGFNWYTPSDFNDDVVLAGSSRKLSEMGKIEVRIFPAMTVMMVGIGATIGKVALSRESSSCNQQINAIVCNSKMTPEFLTYFLRIMRVYIYRCGKFTTLPIINQEDTKALAITCPPLNEQHEIVSILNEKTDQTEALIGKIQISINKLREYRTALISAAVTGKIDVRTMPAGGQKEVS